jgi:hypothetical protein
LVPVAALAQWDLKALLRYKSKRRGEDQRRFIDSQPGTTQASPVNQYMVLRCL